MLGEVILTSLEPSPRRLKCGRQLEGSGLSSTLAHPWGGRGGTHSFISATSPLAWTEGPAWIFRRLSSCPLPPSETAKTELGSHNHPRPPRSVFHRILCVLFRCCSIVSVLTCLCPRFAKVGLQKLIRISCSSLLKESLLRMYNHAEHWNGENQSRGSLEHVSCELSFTLASNTLCSLQLFDKKMGSKS